MPILAFFIAAVAILGSSDAADAQSLRKLRVTIPVPAMVFYPLYVAQDQGFFAKEGLEVEIISTAGDGPDVDALIAGSVDFTVSTPNRLMTAFEQGKPLLAVMNMVNRMAIDCVMNKAIADKLGINTDTPLEQKLKSMKGQTVAGTRPGAFTYLLLIIYAKRAGLEPQRDVQVIGVGGPGSMLPAVENAQVAVACTGSPMPELAVARGKSIAFTQNLQGKDPAFNDFLFELVYARPDWAKANADTVRSFTRALINAIMWIQDTPNERQLPGIRTRFTGTEDPVLLTILENLKPAFKRDGQITKTSVDKAAAFLIDSGALKTAPPWEAISTNDYLPK